jgi:hypothetical protein
VNAFFPKIAEFHKPPHHVKWREVNLASTLPGWTRLESAEAWLNDRRNRMLAEERAQFDAFLQARGASGSQSAGQNDRLFQEFLKWSQAGARQ